MGEGPLEASDALVGSARLPEEKPCSPSFMPLLDLDCEIIPAGADLAKADLCPGMTVPAMAKDGVSVAGVQGRPESRGVSGSGSLTCLLLRAGQGLNSRL